MGKQCPNCGKELKDNAKFCSKCGKELNRETEKLQEVTKGAKVHYKNKKHRLLVWGVCICIGLFIITRFIGNEPKEEYVINAARNVVDKQLIAPATSIYSNEKILEKDDYGRYLVYLDVDAENSYGAKVRSEWCVVVFSVTKDDFHYNSDVSYVNSYSGTDVKSEAVRDMLKEFNDWNKPLEE